MPRKKKSDDKPAEADGAVEQDNAPGSPSEDAAPQAASSDPADDGTDEAATASDVAATADDDDRGGDEGAEESDETESAPEDDVVDGDAEQVLFDSLCGLAVRQDAELRLLRAAVEPFAKQVEDAEAKRGPAFAKGNTVPISLGRLQELRDALRFRALAPADANDEAILEAAQPGGD